MSTPAYDPSTETFVGHMSLLQGLKHAIKSRHPLLWNFGRTTNQLRKLLPRVYGYEPRSCPICGYRGKFHAEIHFPDIFTYDAVCPNCGSLPRNRLLKVAVDEFSLLSNFSRVLHFAPERSVTGFIRPDVALYKTSDIDGRYVDYQLDVQQIDCPDSSWDLVICSHVLEHVDHRRALKELYRILAPGGRLLALFPIVDAWATDYENPTVTSPRDRGLHFGKDNHLRRFGASVSNEFVNAGFELHRYAPIGPEIVTLGLIPGETLFIGRKPD
jgi:hypothetical protein